MAALAVDLAHKAAELELEEDVCLKEDFQLKEIAGQHRVTGMRAGEAATAAFDVANKHLGDGSLQQSLEARGHAEQLKSKATAECCAADTALEAVRPVPFITASFPPFFQRMLSASSLHLIAYF